MSDANDRPPLADRLDKLFDEIRAGGRGGQRYTNEQVAAAMRRDNPYLKVSGAYLSALRTGVKQNPSHELLRSLAKFFGVPPSYFIDDAAAAQTDAAIALAKVVANHGVRRLALRALDLTPEGLAAITQMVEHVLRESYPQPRPPERPERDGY